MYGDYAFTDPTARIEFEQNLSRPVLEKAEGSSLSGIPSGPTLARVWGTHPLCKMKRCLSSMSGNSYLHGLVFQTMLMGVMYGTTFGLRKLASAGSIWFLVRWVGPLAQCRPGHAGASIKLPAPSSASRSCRLANSLCSSLPALVFGEILLRVCYGISFLPFEWTTKRSDSWSKLTVTSSLASTSTGSQPPQGSPTLPPETRAPNRPGEYILSSCVRGDTSRLKVPMS
jgi:hypothetical protein